MFKICVASSSRLRRSFGFLGLRLPRAMPVNVGVSEEFIGANAMKKSPADQFIESRRCDAAARPLDGQVRLTKHPTGHKIACHHHGLPGNVADIKFDRQDGLLD
jgi:hypothetical protein